MEFTSNNGPIIRSLANTGTQRVEGTRAVDIKWYLNLMSRSELTGVSNLHRSSRGWPYFRCRPRFPELKVKLLRRARRRSVVLDSRVQKSVDLSILSYRKEC
jgi:hypothetical protein